MGTVESFLRYVFVAGEFSHVQPLQINFVLIDAGGRLDVPTRSIVWDYIPDFGLPLLNGGRDSHLLGQHTVRMSPISTAQLNPYSETFCLPNQGSHVLIPLLLNNTNPVSVKYTLTPLAYSEPSKSSGKIEYLELSARDLRAIEQSRVDQLQLVRAAAKKESDEYEYDDDDDEEDVSHASGHSLQKSQHLTYIRLSKPGTLRLDRVIDSSSVDARLVYPGEITVVPCPRAEYAQESITFRKDVRCATPGIVSGAGEEVQLAIDIYGVPPLSLRWQREVGHKREAFMVEGIEGPEHEHQSTDDRRVPGSLGQRAPTQVRVPLTVLLDALGTHTYTLESVTDALGNVAQAGQHVEGSTALARKMDPFQYRQLVTTRSVTVLRRPSVSFKHCGPGHPASLLIGAEAPLTISAVNADTEDAPWDVTVQYEPPHSDDGAKASKRYKGWTKTLTTQAERRELTLRASAPGDYTIMGVKGHYCEGDVLSPETCKVVERPLPSAEIEWKKIHEWYVSQSMLLCLGLRPTDASMHDAALVTLASLHPLSSTVHRHSKYTIAHSAIRNPRGSYLRPSPPRAASSQFSLTGAGTTRSKFTRSVTPTTRRSTSKALRSNSMYTLRHQQTSSVSDMALGARRASVVAPVVWSTWMSSCGYVYRLVPNWHRLIHGLSCRERHRGMSRSKSLVPGARRPFRSGISRPRRRLCLCPFPKQSTRTAVLSRLS